MTTRGFFRQRERETTKEQHNSPDCDIFSACSECQNNQHHHKFLKRKEWILQNKISSFLFWGCSSSTCNGTEGSTEGCFVSQGAHFTQGYCENEIPGIGLTFPTPLRDARVQCNQHPLLRSFVPCSPLCREIGGFLFLSVDAADTNDTHTWRVEVSRVSSLVTFWEQKKVVELW